MHCSHLTQTSGKSESSSLSKLKTTGDYGGSDDEDISERVSFSDDTPLTS